MFNTPPLKDAAQDVADTIVKIMQEGASGLFDQAMKTHEWVKVFVCS
jgi:hypothetical protein